MPDNDSPPVARLVGLVYTGDIDTSLAGYEALPGFGQFEIPLSGSITAVVGKNGAGKSRFLSSIGSQTELVFAMESPTSTSQIQFGKEIEKLPRGLWGLAPTPVRHGLTDHVWISPDTAGWEYGEERGVRSLWGEHPRDRFQFFLKFLGEESVQEELLSRQRIPELIETSGNQEPPDTNLLTSSFVADFCRQLDISPEPLRHLAAYAATAMYAFSYRIRADLFQDIFLAALGLEIAGFKRIGITGATTNTRQRLRFYFQDDPSKSPACSALLRAQAQVYGLAVSESNDTEELQRISDAMEELESIVYVSDNAGLTPPFGSEWKFSPLLPLELDSGAGVIHEGANPTLWLEGIRPTPRGASWQVDGIELDDPFADSGCALSWRLAIPSTDLSWLLDLQPNADGIMDVGAPFREERLERQKAWQKKLIRDGVVPDYAVQEFHFHEDFLRLCERAVRAVNTISSVISTNCPLAMIDVSDGVVRWRFLKEGPLPQSPEDLLDINDLSFGERRWLRFANLLVSRFLDRILTTYGDDSDRDWVKSHLREVSPGVFPGSQVVMVLDEPELGLHPTAVDRLARGLCDLSGVLGIHFVVATHSPYILGVVQGASGTIAHATVDIQGKRVFQVVDNAELSSLSDDLGMKAVDLLQMTSTFLLVEGEHDRIVIDALIGTDIRRAGVVITPLRGAMKVSQIVDSDLVWRFTDARLVLVLDSIDNDRVRETLDRAKKLVDSGHMREALDSIAPLKRDRTAKGRTEREALYELLRAAISAKRIDRLEFFGLREPDIIDYFHPRELGPLEPGSEFFEMDRREAWDRLHTKYMNTPKRERNESGFKSWVVAHLGVGDDPSEVLKYASTNLGRVPQDLAELRDLLCSVRPRPS